MLSYTKILSIMYVYSSKLLSIKYFSFKQSTVLNDSSCVILGSFLFSFFKCLLEQNYNCSQNVCIQFIFCNFTARAVGMLVVS